MRYACSAWLSLILACPSYGAQTEQEAPPPGVVEPPTRLELAARAAASARAARDAADSERLELERRVAGAQALIEQLTSEPPPPAPQAGEGLDSAALGALLGQLEEQRTLARTKRDAARTTLSALTTRRSELPTRVAAARQHHEALPATAPTLEALENEDPARAAELRAAEAERLTAEREAAAADLRRLEAEWQGQATLEALASAEEQAAQRALAQLDVDVARLGEARSARLTEESRMAEAEAQAQARAAAMQSKELADEAAINVGLAEERGRLAERRTLLPALEVDVASRLEALRGREQDTKEREEAVGLTAAVGLHLRQERLDLGDARPVRARLRGLEDELARLNLRLIELKGDAARMPSRERWSEQILAQSGADDAAGRAIAGELWDARMANLEALRASLRDGTRALFQIQALEEQYLVRLQAYQSFIDERVLWVRSAPPVWALSPRSIARDAGRVITAEVWTPLLSALRREARRDVGQLLGIGLFVIALFVARPAATRRLTTEGVRAGQRSQTSLLPTLRACFWTVMIVAPVAAVALLFSWRIAELVGAGVGTAAFARSCAWAAAEVIVIGILRRIAARGGLAEAHFDWSDALVRTLRRDTLILQVVLPLATLADALLATQDGRSGNDVLGRIAFTVGLLALAVFAWHLLHPRRGLITAGARDGAFAQQIRRLLFLTAMGLVAGLVALVVLGYAYSARQLFVRMELTLALGLVLLVAKELALRELLMARKREAFERLRRRREEALARQIAAREARLAAGEELEDEEDDDGLTIEEKELDFGALTEDARKLVRVSSGFAAILLASAVWSDVLPALGVLDGVPLWSEAGGGRVTLRNLLVALAVLLLGQLAARSLPSVLEIAVLRRFDLASGERHAITTLVRYGVTILVFVLAFDQLGVPWSKAQWLVAGISVGLGFGLQEIFANFVSGLVLLFERPIRVGDWVTLGEVEGVVSRIRIRATTIRDRDLKELVVPNKEFVTGRFINWTLSDLTSRVVVPVGIAYGSDTEAAVRILLECGRTSPFQVEEPGASVVFRSFGSSSLEFELRVFVNGRDIQPRVVHDLHMRIDAAFRAAKIEIAFPQHDVHIRGLGGLEKLIPRPAGGGAV